jgi:hypothetical protein
MEVSCQHHAPAALPRWETASLPIGQEAGWDPDPVWTWWLREYNPFTALAGNWIPVVQLVASSLYWLSYPSSYVDYSNKSKFHYQKT